MDATQFQRTVKRIADLKAQIKSNEAEVEALYGTLGDLEIKSYPAGDYILKIERNVRFDPVTAKKNLTPEQYASILKATPNSALAKALLDEADYAKAQKEFAPKRTIVAVDDEDV